MEDQMSIATCLWYVDEAEEAANFYVSLFPDARVDRITRYPIDSRNARTGDVMTVEFTLDGKSFMGLNGFEPAEYTHAMSISVTCADQAEVDRLWDALLDGGQPVQCGWLKDRWGVHWQIVPKNLTEFIASSDRAGAARAMRAMLDMVKLDAAALEAAFQG